MGGARAQATFDAVLRACGESAACRKSHPDPAATLTAIAAALGPVGRDVDAVDPRTGMVTRLHLTFDGVLALLQPLLYTPDASSLLPEMLGLAAAGDYGPLFAATQSTNTNPVEQAERRAALFRHLRRGRSTHHTGARDGGARRPDHARHCAKRDRRVQRVAAGPPARGFRATGRE